MKSDYPSARRAPRILALATFVALLFAAASAVLPAGAPLAEAQAPAAPSLSVAAGDTYLKLTWTATADSSITQWHYTTDDGFIWWPVPGDDAATRTHYVTGLRNGKDYRVLVRAKNASGDGAQSNRVIASPTAATSTPSAPTNLSVSAGDTIAKLTWTRPTGADVHSYQYSSNNGTNWSNVNDSGPDTTSFIVTGLSNATAYNFKLRARNSAGTGTATSAVAGTPAAATSDPAAPGGLKTKLGRKGELVVFWNEAAGAKTYQVQRKKTAEADSTYANCGNDSDARSRERVCNGLDNGTQYTIRVRAKNSNGNSSYATITATPQDLLFGYLQGHQFTLYPGAKHTVRLGTNRPFYHPNSSYNYIQGRVQGGPGLQNRRTWLHFLPFGQVTAPNGQVISDNRENLGTVFTLTEAQPYVDLTYASLNKPYKGRDTIWEHTIVDRRNTYQTVTWRNSRTRITYPNTVPTAVAGPDQKADATAVVTLDGSQSLDDIGRVCCPDPTTSSIKYEWKQKSTDTTKVVLQNADKAIATFVAPSVTAETVLNFTLKVTDNTVSSDSYYHINPGHNHSDDIKVTVSANSAAASDANLGGITITDSEGAVALSPAFKTNTTSYTATSPVTKVTIAGTPRNPSATVAYSPTDADTSTAGHQVNLTRGSQTAVTITVTATNTTTTKAYTVNVKAAGPGIEIRRGPATNVSDSRTLSIWENRNEHWDMRLTAKPTANVVVTTSRNTGGDTSLRALQTSKTFTTSNWNTWQRSWFRADPDDDAANGKATFTLKTSSGDNDAGNNGDTGYAANANVSTTIAVTEIDDDLPWFRIDDAASVQEGDRGDTSYLVFPITIGLGLPDDLILMWSVTGGTASATADLAERKGQIHIKAGQTSARLAVPVTGDNAAEQNETVIVTLSGQPSASQTISGTAAGVILNDDGARVELIVSPASVMEGGDATVSVRLLDSTRGARVRVTTAVGSAEATDWVQRGDEVVDVQPGGAATKVLTLQSLQDSGRNSETVIISAVVIGASASSVLSQPDVTWTIIDDDAPPNGPTNLAAEPAADGVQLTWTAPVGGAPISGYEYRERRADGQHGNWRDYQAWKPAGTGTSVLVDGLVAGKNYIFEVRAVNPFGASRVSNEIHALAPAATTQSPGAPRSLTAEAADARVILVWRAPARGAVASYEYSIDGGAWRTVPSSDKSTISYVVRGLANEQSYNFRVRARNAQGVGGPSNVASATPVAAPRAPGGFAAEAGNRTVKLTWTKPAGTVTGYDLRINGGNWTAIAGSGAATTSHTVSALTNGTAYTFEVRAWNDTGTGAASASVSATPDTPPGALTALSVSSSGDQYLTLTWSGPAGTVTGYQYRVNAGMWISLPRVFTKRINNLTNGRLHTVEVRARRGEAVGPTSSTSGTPQASGGTPGSPSGVTAKGGDARVTLSWTPPNGKITGYQWTYSTNAGLPNPTWRAVPNSNADTTSFVATHSGIVNGTRYYFLVRAVNGGNSGIWGNRVSATPRAAPAAPTNLSATAGDGTARLTWSHGTGGGQRTGYQYRSKAGSGAFSDWFPILGATAHSVGGLKNDTAYTFEVRAVNANQLGSSAVSAKATPRAKPTTEPQNPRATAGTDATATLSWGAPSGDPFVEYYEYCAKADADDCDADTDNDWTSTSSSALSTLITSGLTDGTAVTFKVRAVNAGGAGPLSDKSNSVTPTDNANAPGVPTGFAVAAGNASATLTWTGYTTGANLGRPTSWEYSTDNGTNWAAISGSSEGTRRYVHTGLANGTAYTFKLRAKNEEGSGTASAGIEVTPFGPPGRVPGYVNTSGGEQEILLTWTAPSGPVTHYEYRLKRRTGRFSFVFDHGWRSTGSNLTRHTVRNLTNGENYGFDVRAVNAAGPSSQFAQPSVWTMPLGGVSNVAITDGTNGVVISWTAPTGHLRGYSYRAWNPDTDNTSGSNNSPAGLATSFELAWPAGTKVSVRITPRFGIAPFELDGHSSSTVTFERPAAAPQAPANAPTGLTATRADSGVSLSWTAPAAGGGDVGWYEVRYKTHGDWGEWTGADGATTSHAITGLDNNVWHTFQVRAANDTGEGPASNTASAMPGPPLVAPTGLTAHATASGTRAAVQLNWVASSAATYEVQRKKSSDRNWSAWTNVGAGASHLVTDLDFSVVWQFRVRAVGSDGAITEPSTVVQAYTLSVDAPTNLIARWGNQLVYLDWDAPATGTHSGYEVRTGTCTADCGGGELEPIISWGGWQRTDFDVGNLTQYAVTGLANGTEYYFQVRPLGSSAASSYASATPNVNTGSPNQQWSLTVAQGYQWVDLSWTLNNVPSNGRSVDYWAYRIADSGENFGENWTTVGGSDANTTSASIGLGCCKSHRLEFGAINAQGRSSGFFDVATSPPLDAPSNVTATATDGGVVLSWDAPAGTPTAYEYRVRTADGFFCWGGANDCFVSTGNGTATSVSLSGLTNGTEYVFQVRARSGFIGTNWSVNFLGQPGQSSAEVSATPTAP